MEIILHVIATSVLGILFHKQVEAEGRLSAIEAKIEILIDKL